MGVVSEGYHVASGKMNRYCFQPGITDVRAQLTAISSWIVGNLGKKITMIYPGSATPDALAAAPGVLERYLGVPR